MIRTGVIGAGSIARQHLSCLQTLPMVETVGICDLSQVMAEATAEQFRIPHWFTDHRRLLRELEPDVVHIATPTRSHVALAVDALEARAHAFVEKPIAMNPHELERLKTLATRNERLLLEDHNYLFSSSVRRILDLLAGGELGDVVHVEVMFCSDIVGPESPYADPDVPHPYSSLPGDAISDFLTHLAYLAHAFVGEHRESHTTWQKRSGLSSLRWDEFRALVDAERGTATLAFSAHSQPEALWLRVHGTKMRATANLFEPLLTIERLWNTAQPVIPVLNGLSMARAHRRSAFGGLWRKLAGRPASFAGLWELLRRFYESLEAGTEPPIALRQIDEVSRLVFDLLAGESAH